VNIEKIWKVANEADHIDKILFIFKDGEPHIMNIPNLIPTISLWRCGETATRVFRRMNVARNGHILHYYQEMGCVKLNDSSTRP